MNEERSVEGDIEYLKIISEWKTGSQILLKIDSKNYLVPGTNSCSGIPVGELNFWPLLPISLFSENEKRKMKNEKWKDKKHYKFESH